MLTGERCVYALFALCGLFAVIMSGSFDAGFGPGAAFVPKIFGALCCVFGAIGALAPGGGAQARIAARELGLIAGGFALYGLFFAALGFFWDAVALALFLTLTFVPTRRRWIVLALEILFVLVLYAVFTQLFQVQFPHGLL